MNETCGLRLFFGGVFIDPLLFHRFIASESVRLIDSAAFLAPPDMRGPVPPGLAPKIQARSPATRLHRHRGPATLRDGGSARPGQWCRSAAFDPSAKHYWTGDHTSRR